MAVYRRGYVRYDGRLTGRLARLLVLPRFAGREILSQRIVTLVLAVAMFWPAGSAVYIYLANRAYLLQGLSSELSELLRVDSTFFVIFMNTQSSFAIILAALVGPSLVADIPVQIDVAIDWRVLAFTALVLIVAGLTAGVAPAIHASRIVPIDRLKDGGRTSGNAPGRQRARAVLVVAQVAVSVFLLVCAGLFVQSLRGAEQLDLGFRTDNVLLLSVDPVSHGFDEPRGRALYRSVAEEIRALPGVRSASWARQTPFSVGGVVMTDVVSEDRRATTPDDPAVMLYNFVSADYFRTVETSLIRGRGFALEDREGGRPVAVINATAAERLWPGEDPIGRRFQAELGSALGDAIEVVGVAEDALYMIPMTQARPYIYLPFEQHYQGTATLHIHTLGDPAALAQAARAIVVGREATMAVFDLMTMRDHLDQGTALLIFRLGAVTVSAFGILGLTLAAVGLFALVSFSVSQRRREFGIRSALGAQTTEVVLLVVRRGLMLTALGIVSGIAVSLALTRFMSALLLGVSPTDPAVFTAITALLTAVALLACLIPARRALRVDPLDVLRAE